MFIVGAPMAHAQGAAGAGEAHDNGRLSHTDFKVLSDARVGMVKAALQLTPEQQQFWPSVEDAIRARSEARYRRLSTVEERMGQWRDVDPVQVYRERADALAERSAGLEKLADVRQPLYQRWPSPRSVQASGEGMRALMRAAAHT